MTLVVMLMVAVPVVVVVRFRNGKIKATEVECCSNSRGWGAIFVMVVVDGGGLRAEITEEVSTL